jgi:hypothetical protein
MRIGAIIVGIDGWEKYTLPLVESIRKWEPDCVISLVDNASADPYPDSVVNVRHIRTDRLCYSAAINIGWRHLSPSDWYIVLSNDVLCTGPFVHILEQLDDCDLVGPQLWDEHGLSWLVGWCVAIPRRIWDTLGGWDEGFTGSSVEDVDFSHRARLAGFGLLEDTNLPFTHLDQRQRFNIIPNYWATEKHNWTYFNAKYGERIHA